jgi:hypothetical protein
MTIKLNDFDDAKSGNRCPIKDVEDCIVATAPQGAKVAFTYPGYVSIVLSNGVEIAFGESLESESGYSWNDFDLQGNNRYADSFGDLGDANLIAAKLWEQAAEVINQPGKEE